MIQRIQTLFLLFAGLCFAALLKLPFATSTASKASILTDQVFDIQDHVALLALTILGIVLSLVAIFLFKNRPLQLKLGYFVIIIAIMLIVATIMIFLNESQFMGDEQLFTKLGIGMPILAIIFAFVANRFINKDEKTVRSMDRLR